MPKAREGESMRGGLFPLSLGGFGGPPREILFLNFERFYVRFNGGFLRLGPDFSRFGHKDISCRVRNRMLDKNFQTVTCFFILFFFTMFLWHYFIYVPAGFSKVL